MSALFAHPNDWDQFRNDFGTNVKKNEICVKSNLLLQFVPGFTPHFMKIPTLHCVLYINITPVLLQQMNEAETLPINLSAGDGGLRKKIGFCRACPQVLYLEYLLHFKCTLAGCNRQPPPLSPLRAVSDCKERVSVKEVQLCELAAAPHKEGKDPGPRDLWEYAVHVKVHNIPGGKWYWIRHALCGSKDLLWVCSSHYGWVGSEIKQAQRWCA